MAENRRGRENSENENVGHNRQERARYFTKKLETFFEEMNYEQPRAPFQPKEQDEKNEREERNFRKEL